MHITEHRTAVIIAALQEKHNAEWCEKYGEPGYHDPAKGIIFANWNDIGKRIGEYLDEAGYECEWSDEWTIDYNHGKAYRTSPDSYGWVSQVAYMEDGEMLTPDDSVSEWVEQFAITSPLQPARALPDWITPAKLEEEGYSAFNGDYESGWHPGQNDNPKAIAQQVFAHPDAESLVFRVKEQSQFYTVFQAFVRYE